MEGGAAAPGDTMSVVVTAWSKLPTQTLLFYTEILEEKVKEEQSGNNTWVCQGGIMGNCTVPLFNETKIGTVSNGRIICKGRRGTVVSKKKIVSFLKKR